MATVSTERPSKEEYLDWHAAELHENLRDLDLQNRFDANTVVLQTAANTHPFMNAVSSGLAAFLEEGVLQPGELGSQLILVRKPFGSAVDKIFRQNCLWNRRWPDAPKGGWLTYANSYSRLDDIIRGTVICRYLEAFELPDDTLVKALGVVFDLDPLPSVLLSLRSRSALELNDAMDRVIGTFRRVFSFLREHLAIYSYDYVPYEGQILTLFRVFLDRDALSENQAYALRSWFFWVSFEEYMQGRPDNFVARVIRAVNAQLEEGYIDFPANKIEADRFLRRRMLKGKALTTAFLTLLNFGEMSKAADLSDASGVSIGEYDTSLLLPVFQLSELQQIRPGVQSAKVPANVFLAPSADVQKSTPARDIILQLAETDEGMSLLEGQLIDKTAVEALRDGDSSSFLNWRAYAIADAASDAIGYEQSE